MQIAVLAATGPTGRHLVHQALDRGHTVTAIARDPQRLDMAPEPGLRHASADVTDPASTAAALGGGFDVLVSALGNAKGGPPGVLTAGATAVAAARDRGEVNHIVWLGAFGSGESGAAAGGFTRALLRLALRDELSDKKEADALILRAGGTVMHVGPLTGGSLRSTWHTYGLGAVPRRVFPRPISRATVAAAMLAEAEQPRHAGTVAVAMT